MKICFIDDNVSITNMFAKLAKIKGHDCVTSNEGRAGLSLLENATFDVVVLDLAMPDFSGMDIIKSLEKDGKIYKQNILVLTASSISNDELENLKQHGVKEILKKPIKMNALLSVLENMCSSS